MEPISTAQFLCDIVIQRTALFCCQPVKCHRRCWYKGHIEKNSKQILDFSIRNPQAITKKNGSSLCCRPNGAIEQFSRGGLYDGSVTGAAEGLVVAELRYLGFRLQDNIFLQMNFYLPYWRKLSTGAMRTNCRSINCDNRIDVIGCTPGPSRVARPGRGIRC